MTAKIKVPHDFIDIQLIIKFGLYDKTVRDALTIQNYEKWSAFIKSEQGGDWASATDYLKHYALGIPVIRAPATNKRIAVTLPEKLQHILSSTALHAVDPQLYKSLWGPLEVTQMHAEGSQYLAASNSLPESFSLFTLRKNDFPYLVSPPLEHWCLWAVREPETSKEIELMLQVECERLNIAHKKKAWFVNPENRKTIKELWHAHIFIAD